MSITLSEIALGATGQMLASLRHCLTKGETHAAEHGIDEAVYLGWRQAPDMFPMTRQVQIACDIPARGLARLAGTEPSSFPDTEKSFSDLVNRTAAAEGAIRTYDTAAIDADPEGSISFPVRQETMTLPRRQFVTGFIVPNLHFHTTMAYALLRACGVPLGKADYLAGGRP